MSMDWVHMQKATNECCDYVNAFQCAPRIDSPHRVLTHSTASDVKMPGMTASASDA